VGQVQLETGSAKAKFKRTKEFKPSEWTNGDFTLPFSRIVFFSSFRFRPSFVIWIRLRHSSPRHASYAAYPFFRPLVLTHFCHPYRFRCLTPMSVKHGCALGLAIYLILQDWSSSIVALALQTWGALPLRAELHRSIVRRQPTRPRGLFAPCKGIDLDWKPISTRCSSRLRRL